MWWYLFFIILILHSTMIIAQTPITDSRCYLESGSAENFLAREDLDVGSIIGKLRINGNPNVENGDIELSIKEPNTNSPVAITPGTKDIVLIKPLDREGVNGSTSTFVDVVCLRRRSSVPVFLVPVNIRVTDVNDNAPKWINAPYVITLSEVTVPGTRILQGIKAIDDDQEGPFSTVEYQVLSGLHSEYVGFVSPLEGTLVLRKPLDYEQLKNFTITLRAQDQGTPPQYSDTNLQIIINDADDQNPKFLKDSYYGELPLQQNRLGELKIRPEPIKALDQDEGIRAPLIYSISKSPESQYFSINSETGAVSLTTQLNPTDFLHPIILVIKATQSDNVDRYALTTLTVARRGIAENRQNGRLNPLTFLQNKFQVKIREDLPIGSRILALPTNKPAASRTIKYQILNKNETHYFTLGELGELILRNPLDYEQITRHLFGVMASDIYGNNATTVIQIDVIDVNDWEPRFRQNMYEFIIPKNSGAADNEPIPLGKLEAADGDRNDLISISIRGAQAHLFHVDSFGTLWLKSDKPNVTEIHLIATATDTGVPTRSSSIPITIIMEDLLLAANNSKWTSSVLGVFVAVFSLFLIIIVVMSFYIYKQKKYSSNKNRRNRIHSSSAGIPTNAAAPIATGNSIGATTNLVHVTHEKLNGNSNVHHHNGGNLRLIGLTNRPYASNAHNNISNNIAGSGSTLSAGASTILAATLERDTQMERDRDNYTETVRSIISRASAARGGISTGQLYVEHNNNKDHNDDDDDDDDPDDDDNNNNNDMDKDSISNSDIGKATWNGTSDDNRNLHRCKKLSWSNGAIAEGIGADAIGASAAIIGASSSGGTLINSIKNGKATEFMGSTDEMGSTENHLTVYF